MFTLVSGGAASGKSEYAESLVLSCPSEVRYYIATMMPFDDECRARIAKHRAMRAGKGFETVECPLKLGFVGLPKRGTVLLECLGNLAANELYAPDGAGDDALTAIVSGIESLLAQCRDLVVVTNDVFSGGNRYADDTDRYLRLLAAANRALAQRADAVCEVVCGLPYYHKGGGNFARF